VTATVWDDERGATLPALQGTVSTDVCVVGLGGAGLSALAELAAQGVAAVGVDAHAIGGGAAGRNAGFLLAGLADFFHGSAARLGGECASALHRHTLGEIARLAAQFPADVTLTGSLRIAATPDELADCDEHRRSLLAHGFAAEGYSGPEGTGLLIPTDGVYHPLRCVRQEAALLINRGISLFENSPVVAIAPGGVTTPDGAVRCATVIVAIDGGLEVMLPELKPRVRTARLQMLATAPARDVSFPRPVYWRYGYEYWQQRPSGELALGGFRDQGGEAEWTTDPAPGGAVQERLERFLRTQLNTAAPVTHRWAACVGYTADRLPVLEQLRERVFAAGAYSGTGNIVSRLCGRGAAQLACGRASEWANLLEAARRRTGANRGDGVATPA
jgi:gamma-glutamylputrescine oxidase